MEEPGNTQVIKMPLPGKSFVNLHITHPRDASRRLPVPPVPSPANEESTNNRLPTLINARGKVMHFPPSNQRPRPARKSSPYKDLRVGLPRISDNLSPMYTSEERKQHLPTRANSFRSSPRSLAPDPQPKVFNTEPVPFHPQLFRSRTDVVHSFGGDPLSHVKVIGVGRNLCSEASASRPRRRISVQRSPRIVQKTPHIHRHGDMWGSTDNGWTTTHHMLHTDRHLWDSMFAEHNDIERMAYEYNQRLNAIKRQTQILTHRGATEFMMGGQKVALSERENADVYQELKRLKSMVLPAVARDLYVGRGFRLPEKHALNRPRGVMTADRDEKPKVNTGSNKQPANKTVVKSAKPANQEETQPIMDLDDVDPNNMEVENQNTKSDDVRPMNSQPTDVIPAPQADDDDVTINCFQGVNTDSLLHNEQMDVIRIVYETATSGDSSVTFDTLKSELPSELGPAQITYIKKLFEACPEVSEMEFLCFHSLGNAILSVSGAALEAYNKVDMEHIKRNVQQFVDLFDSVDRHKTGKINLESLSEVLKTAGRLEADADAILNDIKPKIEQGSEGSIQKLFYLACIPYFVSGSF